MKIFTPRQKDSFGIYIHIPYCISKCPYCDFNSYGIHKSAIPEKAYAQALIRELHYFSNSKPFKEQKVHSIFFGGGTPSLFSAEVLISILQAVSNTFCLMPFTEITLEANPGSLRESIKRDMLLELRNHGFNRISFGAQSFNSEKLETLGRIHSAEDTRRSVHSAIKSGFDNINLDIMFGLKKETWEILKKDLNEAIKLNPQHISCYGLTIEPGTEFFRKTQKGHILQISEDEFTELYQATENFLSKNNFKRYEISNFSQPGKECIHNLAYWNGANYLGLGAGAHSYDGNKRWINLPGPSHYIGQVNQNGHSKHREEILTKEQKILEFFITRLRTKTGLSLLEYEAGFGEKIELRFLSELEDLQSKKLIQLNGQNLSLSDKGFLFADSVFETFALA